MGGGVDLSVCLNNYKQWVMPTQKVKITSDSREKIAKFDRLGLHYNLVADAVYNFRKNLSDPFGAPYMRYIIAALVSFDMGRMMGPNAKRYDTEAGGFAATLQGKLKDIRPYINHLVNLRIDVLPIRSEAGNIKKAYDILSSPGEKGLNQTGHEFHVGASKILHFLNPEAFIIIDSNAARAFSHSHDVGFRSTTQPGYSSDKYIECMRLAKKDVLDYGFEKFCALNKGVPLARIYDKLTFITGMAGVTRPTQKIKKNSSP